MFGLFIWSILMIFIGVCVGYIIGLVSKTIKEKGLTSVNPYDIISI